MTIVSGQFGTSPSITHSIFPAPPTANRWNDSLVMNLEHWLIRLMAGSDKKSNTAELNKTTAFSIGTANSGV